MNEKLKFTFPETRLYLIFIFILGTIVFYFDSIIGTFVYGVLLYMIFYNAYAIRQKNSSLLEGIENLSVDMDSHARQVMLDFPVAFCIINPNGRIQWHNKKFSDLFQGKNLLEQNLGEYLNKIDIEKIIPEKDQKFAQYKNYTIKDKIFNIESLTISTESANNFRRFVIYLFDITDMYNLNEKYNKEKLSFAIISLDSFEDVLNSTSSEFQPMLQAEIQRRIQKYIEEKNGILIQSSKDKYAYLFNEQALEKMEDEKFSILDEIRELEFSNTIPITLSIGVSSFQETIQETYNNAVSCLEMAQARGGDQAVFRSEDKTIFYGGKTKAVEKKTRVRARIIGHAMRDMILGSDQVFVMGHKNPDLDAFGAAMGVVGICKMLGKHCNIVMDKPNSTIDILYKKVVTSPDYQSIFVTRHEALMLSNPKESLLVVVDTHRPVFTECPELIEKIDKIIMIDHHRRGVDYLDKAELSFHETYASSASEMVTELIQYVKDSPTIPTLIAEALLAGITLDTRNFEFKAGVRTFEAAAFLRKNGADTIEVKKLFQGDLNNFVLKADAIGKAKIIEKVIAITTCQKTPDNTNLIAAQVADELLDIKGVKASFVLAQTKPDTIAISARSLEDINVQVIMEDLGGGGHIDNAGAQVKNQTIEEVQATLEETIKNYLGGNN